MPRLWKAMKDAISCEKPRGLANTKRSAGIRMGQPDTRRLYHLYNYRGKRGELKHLSTHRNIKQK